MVRGRPINLDTKLGRYITTHNFVSYEVANAGGFSPRLMTEYLAGRRVIKVDHLVKLCQFLRCEPEDIVDEEITHNLTTATGRPIDPAIKSVKDLPKLIRSDRSVDA
jgi:DNA-binding Xre family transcriptional regulator